MTVPTKVQCNYRWKKKVNNGTMTYVAEKRGNFYTLHSLQDALALYIINQRYFCRMKRDVVADERRSHEA